MHVCLFGRQRCVLAGSAVATLEYYTSRCTELMDTASFLTDRGPHKRMTSEPILRVEVRLLRLRGQPFINQLDTTHTVPEAPATSNP